jgi:periplasmic divalent cation tolerance protein
VQTLPIQSAYRWKGAIQREPETLALIKTQAALYPEVEAFIRSVHDYETPEIVFIPIAAGSPPTSAGSATKPRGRPARPDLAPRTAVLIARRLAGSKSEFALIPRATMGRY